MKMLGLFLTLLLCMGMVNSPCHMDKTKTPKKCFLRSEGFYASLAPGYPISSPGNHVTWNG